MTDGVQNEAPKQEAQENDRLDALGQALAKKRSDAIQAREACGIESAWAEDSEFILGIDELNRNEHANAWRTKPPGSYQVQAAAPTRSTIFTNITQPYVNAAAARFADMVLPSDDRNFEIRATPIADLVKLAAGQIPASVQASAMQAQNKEGVKQVIDQASQQAQVMLKAAKEGAEKAQMRIDDWLVECQYHAEVRKAIEDCAGIGTGILKGPVAMKRKSVAVVNGSLVIKTEIVPGSKRVDPWNFYPDPSCGENIHNGSHCFERDFLSPHKLAELKGQPGYIDAQLDACLSEGPTTAVATTKDAQMQNGYVVPAEGEKRFEVWYFHGFIGKEDLEAAGCECDEGTLLPAIMTLVNARVVRASLNPLDTGDLPYDLMPWQRRSGMPWGSGVSRQGRAAQRIVLAGVRNMMDNAGLSAGPQIVLDQTAIVPADKQWSITPRKIWYKGASGDSDDVRKAMAFFEIPSRQNELMAIIQFGLKMMEDATGLPMLLQGQLGKAPDTVGGMTMLNNNANAVLRRLARTFDECVTEPHIRRYYNWLLQYGEDSEKGDFFVDARGSSALVERDIQAQEIAAMANVAANPVYGIDPKKWATEMLRSHKFDPSKFQFDDQQWQQIVERMSQKPPDLRLEVEKLKQQGEMARQDKQLQADTVEAEKGREVRIILGKINERIAAIKTQGAQVDTLEQIKADLASLAMKLSTQKEIAASEMAVSVNQHNTPKAAPKEVVKPAAEPPRRAKPGQSFAR